MKKTCALLIVIFWAVMMGLLIRREVLPSLVRQPPVGYQSALLGKVGEKKNRMGIYIGEQRVGQADTFIKTYTDGSCRIRNKTTMHIGFVGSMKLNLSIFVLPSAKLQSFLAKIDSAIYKNRIYGQVTDGKLIVSINTGNDTTRMTIPFDPDTVISGNMFPLIGMPRLRVGDEWQINFLDPLTIKTSTATARVESKEKRVWQGVEIETFVVVFRYSGIEMKAWVDPKGEILEQRALGIVMKREVIDDTDYESDQKIR